MKRLNASALPSRGATANNGMHPTRDTTDFIISRVAGGRVMPGVMLLPSNLNIARL
jgi:hypothetical protein